eukprot:CAMPEP_0170366986 /NCGR_PEP_ID=MMETSP0117_2-20130122/6701_1 /TAXON_ID=400756 /ORGANISM="Durinskia baltica, Strain CSIRO CS-38" /LENGTH=195 /DNA_ID=CAMNT_0010621593 /DNA_START=636 /DNA_END=1224 /DNA_ORIENTATION=-
MHEILTAGVPLDLVHRCQEFIRCDGAVAIEVHQLEKLMCLQVMDAAQSKLVANVGVFVNLTNSEYDNAPSSFRRHNLKSSSMLCMISCCVAFNFASVLRLFLSMVSRMCSIITARITFKMPNVTTTIAMYKTSKPIGAPSKMGRPISSVQESNVQTCKIVNIDCCTLPTYFAASGQARYNSSEVPTDAANMTLKT